MSNLYRINKLLVQIKKATEKSGGSVCQEARLLLNVIEFYTEIRFLDSLLTAYAAFFAL